MCVCDDKLKMDVFLFCPNIQENTTHIDSIKANK